MPTANRHLTRQVPRQRTLFHGRVQSVRPQVRVHRLLSARVRTAVGAGRSPARHVGRGRVAQHGPQMADARRPALLVGAAGAPPGQHQQPPQPAALLATDRLQQLAVFDPAELGAVLDHVRDGSRHAVRSLDGHGQRLVRADAQRRGTGDAFDAAVVGCPAPPPPGPVELFRRPAAAGRLVAPLHRRPLPTPMRPRRHPR